MSIFASSVPCPSFRMLLMAESIVMYDREQSNFGMYGQLGLGLLFHSRQIFLSPGRGWVPGPE